MWTSQNTAGHFVDAPILRRTDALDTVESLTEESVVGLFTVQQKIDRFPDITVRDLAVQIFVDHLGPLLGGDVGQKVDRQIRNILSPSLACVLPQLLRIMPSVLPDKKAATHFRPDWSPLAG